jgi:cupin fold WbuC family metalloprotein
MIQFAETVRSSKRRQERMKDPSSLPAISTAGPLPRGRALNPPRGGGGICPSCATSQASVTLPARMAAPIQLISIDLLERTVERAKASPRLRTNHNFHPSDASNLHRFLNALVRGTYVTPHRHVTPPKDEVFLVLTGKVAFYTFDDLGAIVSMHRLGEGGLIGIDVEPGVWHAMAVLSESAVIYEVKPGPYAPMTDKDFAPFAPREGDHRAPEYLAQLLEYAEKFAQ